MAEREEFLTRVARWSAWLARRHDAAVALARASDQAAMLTGLGFEVPTALTNEIQARTADWNAARKGR